MYEVNQTRLKMVEKIDICTRGNAELEVTLELLDIYIGTSMKELIHSLQMAHMRPRLPGIFIIIIISMQYDQKL
jgi:hypothetical protein